ncbi:MAG: hypothetical protein LC808_23520 [Actinobacteria bacterium]|nr:hypothetical protein [Actinomycetota bacterium]
MTDARSGPSPVLKSQDAPTEVLIVDPITLPVARLLARWRVHPLQVTAIAFVSRMAAAAAFFLGALEVGAVLSILGFLLDGIDGKVARLRSIDEELHGTLDFLSDQTAFAAMALGAVSWTSRSYRLSAVLCICLWLAAYMLMMAFTSTWFRLLLQTGNTEHQGAARRILSEEDDAGGSGWCAAQLALLVRAFTRVNGFTSRYRMLPYPGAIESEVVVFMVAPFFAFNWYVVLFGAVLLLPDIAINLIMDVTIVVRRRS